MNSGLRHLTVHDRALGLSYPALVQYPTTAPASGVDIGPYRFDATPDAPVASGRFPVCVISHGGGGSHLIYRSIGTYLAAHGFIVVCPEHPGDNRNDRSLVNTDEAAARRPRHVSLAANAILDDVELGAVADASRLCIVGHSMGGFTALALAGGLPWSRPGLRIDTEADARFKAAVLLAPATGWYLAPHALDQVHIPLLVLTAELDQVTSPDAIRLALRGLPPTTPLTFDVIAGAGHYSFITPFPPPMRRPDFPPSTDPDGFDREAFHQVLPQRIGEFLRHALG